METAAHIASIAALLISFVAAFFTWRKKPSRLDTPARIVAERVAYGLPAGTGLEFADELTLSHALEGRREMPG